LYPISAVTGAGIEELKWAMAKRVASEQQRALAGAEQRSDL
jgi:hypothetical protein